MNNKRQCQICKLNINSLPLYFKHCKKCYLKDIKKIKPYEKPNFNRYLFSV